MFLCVGGGIGQVIEPQFIGSDPFFPHFPATDTFALLPASFEFFMYVHSQAGAFVAVYHVRGRDVADDAVDAAVAGDGRFDIGKQVDEFVGFVGVEFAALPVLVQFGVGEELVGVDFDLVRAEPFPKSGEVFPVAVRGCAVQVGHPVKDDFEPTCPEHRRRVARFPDGMTSFVDFKDVIVKTLRAHLYFRDAEMPQPGQFVRGDVIRAGFDDEADVAVLGGFVEALGGEEVGVVGEEGPVIEGFRNIVGTPGNSWELLGICRNDFSRCLGTIELVTTFVHRLETAQDEPFLVVAAVGAPCAAEDEEFDLVGGVADGFEGGEAFADLGVGVKLVLEGAHGAGFVGEVAFGHPPVGGAEDALAGAGVGFGEDGDGGDAGEGPHGFHAEAFEEFGVWFEFPQFDRFVIRGDQKLFANVAPALAG